MTRRISQLQKSIRKFSKAREWDQFHSPKNLSMALSVEAAEIVEIFQWLSEKESQRLSYKKLNALSDELADTYIYLLKLADHYKIDLINAAFKKLKKTALKYPVSKSRGSAKKYSEL